MNNSLGLYIHIPFCRSKCPYCDFFSMRSDKAGYEEYADVLKEKIRLWGKKTNKITDTVYFGGGTPSVLGTELLSDILSCIRNSFTVTDDAEITLEANPDSGKKLDFERLRALGLNRVSLGLQSANENEMKTLGRIHSLDDVKDTVSLIRKSGIDNISLDLMMGIPDQTKESLKNSIDFCADIGAKHISSYILKLEENTVFYNRRDKYSFPDEDETAELYIFAVDYLDKKGFKQYEISNFSIEGFESKHNTKYWKLDDYLGIGPAAHSFMDGKRFFYERSLQSFKNDVIIDDGKGGSAEEYIMLRLRLKEGLSINKCKEAFGDFSDKDFLKKIKKYSALGLMDYDGDKVSFTPKGFLVSNSILAELI